MKLTGSIMGCFPASWMGTTQGSFLASFMGTTAGTTFQPASVAPKCAAIQWVSPCLPVWPAPYSCHFCIPWHSFYLLVANSFLLINNLLCFILFSCSNYGCGFFLSLNSDRNSRQVFTLLGSHQSGSPSQWHLLNYNRPHRNVTHSYSRRLSPMYLSRSYWRVSSGTSRER